MYCFPIAICDFPLFSGPRIVKTSNNEWPKKKMFFFCFPLRILQTEFASSATNEKNLFVQLKNVCNKLWRNLRNILFQIKIEMWSWLSSSVRNKYKLLKKHPRQDYFSQVEFHWTATKRPTERAHGVLKYTHFTYYIDLVQFMVRLNFI